MGLLGKLACAYCLIAGMAGATTYYVATNGDDSQDGSEGAPFRTVMRGVAAAGPGDTVLVRDGTYYSEGVTTCGDECQSNRSPVVIIKAGTPSAYITIKSENKWGAVLDCQLTCDSYINLAAGAAFITIEGFVIRGGYWDGIHSNDDAHDILIRGNRFEDIGNRPTTSRFGISGMFTNPACYNFVFDGNIFHSIGRTSPHLSLDHGLYLRGRSFTIVNNIFFNLARGWAIQAAEGLTDALIANNTFAFQNPARGGHIMLWQNQTNLTIRNNIFFHVARSDPGDWAGTEPGFAIARWTSRVTNCSIDHNLIIGAFGIVADAWGCSVSDNRIAVDPPFVRGSGPPFDFRLAPGSAGIDAGIDIPGLTTDFDGNPRPQGAGYDVGAFESLPTIETAVRRGSETRSGRIKKRLSRTLLP